jgi:hypothetical protein
LIIFPPHCSIKTLASSRVVISPDSRVHLSVSH